MSVAETGDRVAADFVEDGVPVAGVDPDPDPEEDGTGAATWMHNFEMAKEHIFQQF
uniref:Uncharacterized protein n=1 Tax=Oryza brachyantha TaxID=4533 RepID=J3MN60_ORYBR